MRRFVVPMAGVVALASTAFGSVGAAAAPVIPGAGPAWASDWAPVCPSSVVPGVAQCHAIQLLNPTANWQGRHMPGAVPDRGASGTPGADSTTPSGYDPTELQAAYDLPSSSAGSGETVAIVDAYKDPDALSNLSTYRAQWGLEPVCSSTVKTSCITFTQESQTGSTTRLPSSNVGWSEEISVDLDMVSATCPLCNILLVEASSATFASLGAAEDTAASAKPVSIGNSYGTSESALGSSETTYDAYYDHPGIAITVASGDDGYGVDYPAASEYVTAVGGTTLETAGTTRGYTETAWSDAGSGCSAYETQPAWQKDIIANCANRAVADVSAVADPNTGVAVYDSYGLSGWTVFGGTSVAAQIISGVYALAAGTSSSPYPPGSAEIAYYANPGSLYYVSSGSNGNCENDLCNAADGSVAADGTVWNGPTGLGTPHGTGAF